MMISSSQKQRTREMFGGNYFEFCYFNSVLMKTCWNVDINAVSMKNIAAVNMNG